MIRIAISFVFGACIAAPFATMLADQPVGHTTPSLESAIYTAVEDGKVSDAVRHARAPRAIELDTVTVVGRVAKSTPRPKPPVAPACKLQRLEQGGGPSAPFVLVCE